MLKVKLVKFDFIIAHGTSTVKSMKHEIVAKLCEIENSLFLEVSPRDNVAHDPSQRPEQLLRFGGDHAQPGAQR
jgi:hypothetical protein